MKAWYVLSYLFFLVREVLAGSWRITRAALSPRRLSSPAIVEFPLRCRSDFEVTALASSITITPGTLVVGTAAGNDEVPPTLFVHALFSGGREAVLDELRGMETRLLRATRGREIPAPIHAPGERVAALPAEPVDKDHLDEGGAR
ncbi:Na+/H+ antiporter subunit E [Austwickia chelonae]|uniref:Na+/H+ antiporter subunit E n=1 Tax=Austwickia chelonae TaxID=100225 RepID=UPI000E24496D|nr:Na+/H+ antiporter subunit E [Austwickia chelonae]